jgi:hypothetical protein
MTWPKFSTTTWSEMSITMPMSCSTRERHAPFLAHVEDEARHVLGLLAVHAGDRLVEHEHARLHGQRAGQLHPLLQAVGQAATGAWRMWSISRKSMTSALDLGAQLHLLALRAGRNRTGRRQQPGLHMRVAAELDVVEHAHAAEQRDVLERAGEPQGGAIRRRHTRDVRAFIDDAALLRPIETGNGIEQRGLARAIGADKGSDGIRGDAQRHVAQRLHAAERQRDILHTQDRGGRRLLHLHSSPRVCALLPAHCREFQCDNAASYGRVCQVELTAPDGAGKSWLLQVRGVFLVLEAFRILRP